MTRPLIVPHRPKAKDAVAELVPSAPLGSAGRVPDEVSAQRRETRLLLATIGVSVAMLLLLARFRFPESARQTAEPSAAPLERLAARATFDELASTMADLERRLANRVEVVRIRPARDAGGFVAAPRLTPDRAVVVLEQSEQLAVGPGAAPPLVIGRDGVRQLAVVALPPDPDNLVTVRSGAPRAGPRYVAVVEATRDGPAIRPVYVGRIDLIQDPRVGTPLLSVGAMQQTLPRGAAIFALDGAFIGLAARASNADDIQLKFRRAARGTALLLSIRRGTGHRVVALERP